MEPPEKPWKTWRKISFRFFFLFFGITSLFCWVISCSFVNDTVFGGDFESLNKLYKPFSRVFYWLDRYIYHTGYDPKTHVSLPVDNHFGVIYYLTFFFLTIIAAIVWGILDKKRLSYNKLSYWFNVYLRYTLAIVILGYGIDKVIPIQMPYPRTVDMITLFGNQSKEDLLWKFMGVSPGYMFFTGSCELTAAFLLFFRRTAVFGYLFLVTILTNVVLLNWFYNISVKLFSSLLLLYAWYLLAPWISTIFQFFFSGAPAVVPQKHYSFEKKWKRYLLPTVLIMVPVLFLILDSIGDTKRYRKEITGARKEKMYSVTAFVAKDSLAADTFRWKRVLFVYDNYMVVYNMKDRQDWYLCDVDSVKKILTLHKDDNKTIIRTMQYVYPSKGTMQLSGKWKGKDIRVSLKLSPVDSMYLNKEKIKIIRD
jgi:hypothetical protein